jgi:hypothetical protein
MNARKPPDPRFAKIKSGPGCVVMRRRASSNRRKPRASIIVCVTPINVVPWFFLLFLTLILFRRRWLSSSLFLFALGVLMLPYLTRVGGPTKFMGMTKYILLAFPVFIVMAKMCESRPWLVPCITGLFAALLFMYSALFAQGHWVG